MNIIFPRPIFLTVDKSIIIFIPSVTWKIIIKVFIRIILFYSTWLNIGRCINNNPFLL